MAELGTSDSDRQLHGLAAEVFHTEGIDPALLGELVQPCLRARSSQDLSHASAVSALIAACKSTTASVDGGNGRLVERLIRLSEADLQLNSTVVAIKRLLTES